MNEIRQRAELSARIIAEVPLLIDGHNLIGHSPDLSLRDPDDEARLIARLKQYVACTGKQVTVVFDPRPNDDTPHFWHKREQHGKLEVIFAAPRSKADDVIRDRVSTTRDRKGLIVVTSDGALGNFVRQSGIRVQSSDEFAKAMSRTLSATPPFDDKPAAGKAEVDEWAHVFKEPALSPKPQPKPQPGAPQLSPQERKRLRRMEQLKKQVRGGGRLI